MGRGVCYAISKSKEDVLYFEESDLYSSIDSLAIDFVKTQTEEDSRASVRYLIDELKNAGAEIGIEKLSDGVTNIHHLRMTDEVKKMYFRARFEKVKALVDEMDLEYFSVGDPYTLKMLIDDSYADCVYEDGWPKTLDYFIREADTDVKYYIAPTVIFLH
ncbi:MAG: hypothetical protein Q4B26_00900 [Eubacteriales bacterium]|nr:hypothetical protein [Eubacteriales bacterium]